MDAADTPPALVILVTAPSAEVARRLARGLVEAGLAPCVNVLPGVGSIYRWEGRIEEAAEQLLLIKCPANSYDAIETWLLSHHPYDVPECVALPIVQGSAAYLAWLLDAARPAS